MKKNKTIAIGILFLILYIVAVVVICQVYDGNLNIIERGYPSTEKTDFAIAFAWAPITLACIAMAVFVAGIVAYVAKRGELSFKKEIVSVVFEIIVGVIYSLSVLAIARDISVAAYKALTITACVLFALYLAYRCADIVVKAYRSGRVIAAEAH